MYVLSVDNIVDALIAKAVTLDKMIDLTGGFSRFSRVSEWVRPTTTNKR